MFGKRISRPSSADFWRRASPLRSSSSIATSGSKPARHRRRSTRNSRFCVYFNHGLKITPRRKSPAFQISRSKLAEPPPRQGFLTDEQYDALQRNAKQPWLKALLAMAYTIWIPRARNWWDGSAQPTANARWQIDLKNRTIRLIAGATKNDEGRVVKMTEEVYDHCVFALKARAPTMRCSLGGRSPVKDFRGRGST